MSNAHEITRGHPLDIADIGWPQCTGQPVNNMLFI